MFKKKKVKLVSKEGEVVEANVPATPPPIYKDLTVDIVDQVKERVIEVKDGQIIIKGRDLFVKRSDGDIIGDRAKNLTIQYISPQHTASSYAYYSPIPLKTRQEVELLIDALWQFKQRFLSK
jgi:hypothetical protein